MILVFEKHDIIAWHYQQYLITNKYIQAAKIEYTKSTQRQQREKTTIPDHNACKAALTDFAILKWPYGMDELIFFMTLRQKLASIVTQIICIDNLRKKLNPACNFNTNNLKVYTQVIVTILQGIVILTKGRLILPPLYEVPNQSIPSMPSKPPSYKAPDQSLLSAPSGLHHIKRLINLHHQRY